jgi:hypothetical protein
MRFSCMRVGVGLVGLAGACTTLSPDPGPPPPPPGRIATLNVTVEGDGEFAPTDVQLAIVWWRDRAVFPERELEPQELLIASHSLSWPMAIEAALTEPPTYDPYWSSPGVGTRPGMLVAYVDQNGNDQLDFTPVTASAFSDRIIAYAAGTRIIHYSTVNVVGQQVQERDIGIIERPIETPIVLPQRSELRRSCHMLEDYRPYFAYQEVFNGIALDPNDPSLGPWDLESASDAPCPNGVVPPMATMLACGGEPSYGFHAKEVAQTSPFIASTCGQVMRICQVRRSDPNAPGPWPCPCDPMKYACTDYEGGL